MVIFPLASRTVLIILIMEATGFSSSRNSTPIVVSIDCTYMLGDVVGVTINVNGEVSTPG
jgi:hypothetical protein